MTNTFAVGLRFQPHDAAHLNELAERAARLELPIVHDLLANAHTATRNGEPLVLLCADANEALDYAHRFTRWGIDRPVIEQLNGLTY